MKSLDFDSLRSVVNKNSYPVDAGSLQPEGWSLANEKWSNIVDKMERKGIPLEEFVSDSIYYGIKTGYNTAFFIDSDTKEELIQKDQKNAEIIKPLLVGDDARRYYTKNKDQWLIYTPWELDIDQYPDIKEYLSNWKEELSNRPECDSGRFEWWALARYGSDYQYAFKDSKIVYPVIAMSPRFAIDDGGHYINDKLYMIPEENYYLLSLLNSDLLFEIAKLRVSVLGDENSGGRLELRATHLKELPICDLPTNDSVTVDIDYLINKDNAADYIVNQLEPTETRNAISQLGEIMSRNVNAKKLLNLSLLDHLGAYDEGSTLADIGFTQPPRGSAESILQETASEKPNLRVGEASVVRESTNTVEIRLTARYKPGEARPEGGSRTGTGTARGGGEDDALDESDFETDQWGYTETDPQAALRITDLTETEADLIEAFVPVAVDEAGGFAGFRETATKTNSLVDRLRKLTLPRVADVEAGLAGYLETNARAEELEAKIESTDALIDEIVYELYGLTDEEIEIVEEAVGE